MNFTESLETAFIKRQDHEKAKAMSKYMRNQFPFFGIKTEDRRSILKTIWEENKIEVAQNSRQIAFDLFAKEQREFHYCAIEIIIKQLKKKYKKEDSILIEKWINTHSWWDSVDTIAKNILGEYLLSFPKETPHIIARFSNSQLLWLNRSALLFQLGYKAKTDFNLLKSECDKHKKSKEFFIQKAIGWALREYAKTNPELVKSYVEQANLMSLSQKEALKNFY